jgi:sulfur carrier protein
VKVIVNGEPREVAPTLTVAELLRQLEVSPRGVAVEVNLQVIPRSQHEQYRLNEGDRLEIVTLVGGG